jgi:putative membrane protein
MKTTDTPPSASTSPNSRRAYMDRLDEASFWLCVWGLNGSITMRIMPDVAVFGAFSLVWLQVDLLLPRLALEVGPVELAGGALGLLLVLRTNAGYDRWWEGRKMWGGMVNDIRSLVSGGLAYGPREPAWQKRWVSLCVCFAHTCRMTLRSERDVASLSHLLDERTSAELQKADHMPSYVAQQMAYMLSHAPHERNHLDFGLLGLERARQALLGYIGSCERIASTPLPRVYVLKIRRFIAIYLFVLPLALVDKVGMATPFLVMLVAYPVLGMDRIAHELQSPFLTQKMSSLPLDQICQTIENNARFLLAQVDNAANTCSESDPA